MIDGEARCVGSKLRLSNREQDKCGDGKPADRRGNPRESPARHHAARFDSDDAALRILLQVFELVTEIGCRLIPA